MIWGLAYSLQKISNLPIASGILGFFMLLFFLEMRWLNLENIAEGADVLLGELLLFFIPPVVGVIQYQELLIISGWKILVAILISTTLVMGASMLMARIFLYQDQTE